MKEASDVMMNGISKKLSMNWGDEIGGRIMMVATTDNDTSINYKLVKDKKDIIPAFCLTTVCNKTSIFPESRSFRNLTIPTPMPILEVIKEESWLENRWMVEVINLEQDNLNETT